MTKEDDVESGHLTGNGSCGVLLVSVGNDATILARVEQTENQVRALHLLEVFHPFLGTTGHLLKFHTFPHIVCQPVGNGRCEHADDSNLHAVDVMDGVGLKACVDIIGMGRTVGTGFHNIRTKQRTAHLTNPFVVNFMSRLDVVVAYGLSIVLHVVDDRGGKVLVLRHHIVRPVDAGLSLQNIAVVDQQEVITIRGAFLFNISVRA